MVDIEIEISLFGRFRRLHAARELRLGCESGIPVGEVKRRLAEKWKDADSLQDSVLALENRILQDDERLFESARLALLPPVCGG